MPNGQDWEIIDGLRQELADCKGDIKTLSEHIFDMEKERDRLRKLNERAWEIFCKTWLNGAVWMFPGQDAKVWCDDYRKEVGIDGGKD